MKQLNRASNLDTIKKNNRSLVLKLLNSLGSISRAELAKITGLTKTSITNITSELIEDQIICESGIAESSSGRKPILLNIEKDARYALGLYISRDYIYVNITNLSGEVVTERKQILDAAENEQSFLNGIAENISGLLAGFAPDSSKILGIGIASIGPIDIERGIILDPPNFRGLKSIHIVDVLKEKYGFETYLDNDMNSCAIAEKLYGKGKSLTDFVYLGVTNGIGAGIVLNGSVYRGKDGFAGEIGHTSIDIAGRQCPCGNLGCLELYADINAVLNQVNASIELGAESLLSGNTPVTWQAIVEAAGKGDRICGKAIEKMAYYLSFGLVNTVNIFNPQAIFLGHEIALAGDMILEPLREMLGRTILYKNSKNMKIEMSAFKEDAPFIGAPSIILNKFFNGDLY
jgi:predicted NBD/HSP70 family sugar kinase